MHGLVLLDRERICRQNHTSQVPHVPELYWCAVEQTPDYEREARVSCRCTLRASVVNSARSIKRRRKDVPVDMVPSWVRVA